MKTNKKVQIILYGTHWCGDTRRACRFLDEHDIDYQFIDIDENKKGEEFVRNVNYGARSVPTIVFPDGTILTEPDERTLAKKCGIT